MTIPHWKTWEAPLTSVIGYLSLLINLPLILLAWTKVDPDFARKTRYKLLFILYLILLICALVSGYVLFRISQ